MIAKPERPARRAKRLALEAARAKGCVCRPDVHIIGTQGDAAIARLYHDDWCRLLRSLNEGAGRPRHVLVLAPKGSIDGTREP